MARRDWARVERAKLVFGLARSSEPAAVPSVSATELHRLHALVKAKAPQSVQRWVDLAYQIRLKRRIDAANTRSRS